MCHFVTLDIAYGSICCFATRYALRGEKVAHIHIECEQSEHISNFERSEKYIEFAIGEHIDKNKGVNQMTDNKNQLREDAIEFAIQISELCDEIKGCSVYINQIVRSSSSIGANIHEAKYAQSKADFISKLEISLKECSETEYWLELIFRKGKMTEATYKDLRNKCGSIRRRLISSITTAKESS